MSTLSPTRPPRALPDHGGWLVGAAVAATAVLAGLMRAVTG